RMNTSTNNSPLSPIPPDRFEVDSLFDHNGHVITLSTGLFDGAERVFVDDRLVSRKRNWKFRSSHAFNIDGVNYEITIAMPDGFFHCLAGLFTGHFTVTLKADGEVVDRDEVRSIRH